MMRYYWEGTDKHNNERQGFVNAPNGNDAMLLVNSQGIYCTKIKRPKIHSRVMEVNFLQAIQYTHFCSQPPGDHVAVSEVVFDQEVTFGDGMRVNVQLIAPDCPSKELCWAEAMLIEAGSERNEIGYTDKKKSFLGEYILEGREGDRYKVLVVMTGACKDVLDYYSQEEYPGRDWDQDVQLHLCQSFIDSGGGSIPDFIRYLNWYVDEDRKATTIGDPYEEKVGDGYPLDPTDFDQRKSLKPKASNPVP